MILIRKYIYYLRYKNISAHFLPIYDYISDLYPIFV